MDSISRSGVTAIVEFDYKAKEPDEIDLIKGAIITNIKKQDIGWWEGTILSNGKTGMFPDNFVRILKPDEMTSQVILRENSPISRRRCKVIYSYIQNNDDELSLEVGNIIDVLDEVEEGWWKGKLGNKIGVFPSNFVVPIEATTSSINASANNQISNLSLLKHQEKKSTSSVHSSREDLFDNSPEKSAPILPPKPIKECCRVLFSYEPQNEDELELQIGDIVTILSKDLPDRGWWKGELSGKIGVFPDNFVQIISTEACNSVNSSHLEKQHLNSSKIYINNDIKDSSNNSVLNETGIISGNVAAQRKSLEQKTIEKSSNFSTTTTTNNDIKQSRKSLESKQSDVRKSLENLDDNKKTPPPVLTKKPIVPSKKQTTTVTNVAGNILSGIKQRVKSVESKLSSHNKDNLDGIGCSKISHPDQIPDNNEKGIIVEKLKKDKSEFDNVERSSMLADMRAGRAKAPKRRPPSTAINTTEEGNNNSIFFNGSIGAINPDTNIINDDKYHLETTNDNDELVKPKLREWEVKKAPWMDELKANQAKKISPSNIESSIKSSVQNEVPINNNKQNLSMSSSLSDKSDKIKSMNSSNDNLPTTTAINQSQSFESKIKHDRLNTSNELSKSNTDECKIRPTNLPICNRSSSPISKKLGVLGKCFSMDQIKSSANNSNNITINNNIVSNNSPIESEVNQENVCSRVMELEQRIHKLEEIIQSQNHVINELVRTLKDEAEKVKELKSELEKYAQCVTQV